MSKPKRIEIGDADSGVCIEYVKSRGVLYIFGWYDHYVGIEGGEMPLVEFCQKLGIDTKAVSSLTLGEK